MNGATLSNCARSPVRRARCISPNTNRVDADLGGPVGIVKVHNPDHHIGQVEAGLAIDIVKRSDNEMGLV